MQIRIDTVLSQDIYMDILNYPCRTPAATLPGKVRVNFSSLSLSRLVSLSSLSLSSLSRLSSRKLAIYSQISYNFTADKDIDLKPSGYDPRHPPMSSRQCGITVNQCWITVNQYGIILSQYGITQFRLDQHRVRSKSALVLLQLLAASQLAATRNFLTYPILIKTFTSL